MILTPSTQEEQVLLHDQEESELPKLNLLSSYSDSSHGKSMKLPSGRNLNVRSLGSSEERITITSPTGEVELQITLTEKGPLLKFHSADLSLTSQDKINLNCKNLSIKVEEDINQEAGGNFQQHIHGDGTVEFDGNLKTRAKTCELVAKRGDVKLQANDDVRVKGERIRLNC